MIRFDGWRLDLGRRELKAPDGSEIALTTGEFDLLVTFARHPGRVLNRDQLMDLTRGRHWEAIDRSIDAQVARLRRKIELDPKHPSLVKSCVASDTCSPPAFNRPDSGEGFRPKPRGLQPPPS